MAVITISRQFGSGGVEIAQMVCQQLGYRYFDKNLMTNLCDPAKQACDNLPDLTEDTHKVQTLMERFFAEYPMSFEEIVARQLEPPGTRRLPEVDFETVQGMILTAYEHGDVVIVGRGGQVILHDKPGVLHVRIEGPLDARISRVTQAEGLDADKARELIKQRDEAALDYVKRFVHADAGDPHLYDLVINTARITPAAAADLIVKAAGSLHT